MKNIRLLLIGSLAIATVLLSSCGSKDNHITLWELEQLRDENQRLKEVLFFHVDLQEQVSDAIYSSGVGYELVAQNIADQLREVLSIVKQEGHKSKVDLAHLSLLNAAADRLRSSR